MLALHWFLCRSDPGLLQLEGFGVHTGIQAGSAVHATRCVVASHWLVCVTQDGLRQLDAAGVHVGTQIGLPVQATVCVTLLQGLLWFTYWPVVQEFGSGVQSQVPGGAGLVSPGSQTTGGQLFSIPAHTCNFGSTASASQRFGGTATAHHPASVPGLALTRSSMSSIELKFARCSVRNRQSGAFAWVAIPQLKTTAGARAFHRVSTTTFSTNGVRSRFLCCRYAEWQ